MTTIKSISENAKKELAALTGFTGPTAIGIKKAGVGWTVNIEIMEKKSIPDGMDVLGLYEVQVDAEGEVMGYSRKGLRKRMDTQAQTTEE